MPFNLFDLVSAACIDPERRVFGMRDALQTPEQRRGLVRDCRQIGQTLRRARRFVIDDELTAVATELSFRPASFLTEALYRSRLPFDDMWIEYSKHVQIDVSAAHRYSDQRSAASPSRSGMLLRRLPGRETTFMAMVIHEDVQSRLNACIQPFGFIWDTEEAVTDHIPGRLQGMSGIAAEAEHGTPGLFALTHRYIEDNRASVERLQNSVGYVMAEPWMSTVIPATLNALRPVQRRQQAGNLLAEVGGDFRFILAILGLINTLRKDTDHVTPTGGRMFGNRHVRYMDYHRIRMRVPKERVIKRLHQLFSSGPRRAHEVMGHWVQRRNGTRYWRRSHVRGDSGLGFVTKDYELLPQRD